MKAFNQSGQVNLLLVLAIFFGIGTFLFGGIAIYSFNAKTVAETDRNAQVAKAVAVATTAQKKADDIANTKANENPYRTYTADTVFGGFSLEIPKSWNIYAEKNVSAPTQLVLIASPDSVSVSKTSKVLQPFKMELLDKSSSQLQKDYNNQYSESLKKKVMVVENVTVSGIPSTKYTGLFDTGQTVKTVRIITPVRDKTMLFTNDDLKYSEQFNKIVASAKITP